MKPNKKILKIHPLDNLIVALSDLNKGEIFNIGNKKIKLKTDVKAIYIDSGTSFDYSKFL